VKGVDEGGLVLRDLVLDGAHRHHREIPEAELDSALPEAARDAPGGDRVAANRWRGEGREHSDSGGHGVFARAYNDPA
jgi:hypothetical protein